MIKTLSIQFDIVDDNADSNDSGGDIDDGDGRDDDVVGDGDGDDKTLTFQFSSMLSMKEK